MSTTVAEVRNLRKNGYMIMDGEQVKIVDISTSKPGKHGEAKARITGVGIFDDRKRETVHPVKHKVQVPMIDKRSAQVISIQGERVQLMDMADYNMFEVPLPDEFKDKIETGKEIQ